MRSLVLGTAGHIDHGKSALVQALTGVHPDRLEEEQRRGITIELGFAHCRIGDVFVSFVDVPGHERFVRTMVAGAAGIDAVMLLVSANESVMPQTREHLDICRLLRVPRGVIVITKIDLATPQRLLEVRSDITQLVAGTFLHDAPVIHTSALTRDGLDHLREAIVHLATDSGSAIDAGPVRLPIDRAFSAKGFGTVVTGTLVTGVLEQDAELEVLPARRVARVRGLQVAGQPATRVAAPSRVAVNLGGVDLEDVARGMTIAACDALPLTRCVDAVVEGLPGSAGVRHGGWVRWLQGTTDIDARVSIIATAVDGEVWRPAAPGERHVVTPAGGRALVRLRFAAPVATTRGDRFVLRLPSPAGTIGGGVVLDPLAPVRGVRRPGTAERVSRLIEATLIDAARIWLDVAGDQGLELQHLARRLGITPRAVSDVIPPDVAPRAGRRLVLSTVVAQLASALTRRVSEYHQQHRSEAGLPRAQARGETPEEVFALVLSAAGIANAERLSMPGFMPLVADEDQQRTATVVKLLTDAALQPPLVSALAEQVGWSAPEIVVLLQRAARTGRVVKVGDLWFAAEALAALTTAVRGLGTGHTFDVAAMKAAFGVSRKFAIPLLEYLDRQRVTRRVGDRRVVL